ncbi:hypothetical protein DFH28DRAFT_830107, partial [Melampsora americana]
MPTSQSDSSDTSTVKGKDREVSPSKDLIIEALHERMKQLELENASMEAKVKAAETDRRRIEALENTISQIVANQALPSARSAASPNPFESFRTRGSHLVTPTPAGLRLGQTVRSEPVHRATTAPATPLRSRPLPPHRHEENLLPERRGI